MSLSKPEGNYTICPGTRAVIRARCAYQNSAKLQLQLHFLRLTACCTELYPLKLPTWLLLTCKW
jgi:hypothetical protein